MPIGSSTQLRPEQQDVESAHFVPAPPHVGVVDWQSCLPVAGSATQLRPEQHDVVAVHGVPATPHVGGAWQLPPVVDIGSPMQISPEQHVGGIAAASHAAPVAPHVGPDGKSTFTCALALRAIASVTTTVVVPVTVVVTGFAIQPGVRPPIEAQGALYAFPENDTVPVGTPVIVSVVDWPGATSKFVVFVVAPTAVTRMHCTSPGAWVTAI
jgi:hypothetical protein